jgi:hypothetical protein
MRISMNIFPEVEVGAGETLGIKPDKKYGFFLLYFFLIIKSIKDDLYLQKGIFG